MTKIVKRYFVGKVIFKYKIKYVFNIYAFGVQPKKFRLNFIF